jgi:cytoskeletal protein RodZ
MDDLRKLEAKGLARAKSRSRRRRVSTIRSRTIRGSLALFAILWAIVFVQLASGNDPVLSRYANAEKHAATAPRPTPAEPVREPAPEAEAEPEFEEEFEPEPEVEVEEAPEVEAAPIVTSSS